MNQKIPAFMKQRIRNVLVIVSPYDQIMLEEEISSICKAEAPYPYLECFSRLKVAYANSLAEALKFIAANPLDLVITSLKVKDARPEEVGKEIKQLRPNMPVVLLTSDNSYRASVSFLQESRTFDYIFNWYGDVDVIRAIIKILEDEMNAPRDLLVLDGRAILVIEDEVNVYSNILPIIYREIITRTHDLVKPEVKNPNRKRRERRCRVKVLLAVNYEEAIILLYKYYQHLIAIISDGQFPIGEKVVKDAGLKFIHFLRQMDKRIPFVLQTRDQALLKYAEKYDIEFIDKESETYISDLTQLLREYHGFGDFVFLDGKGNTIDRATTIRELKQKLAIIPEDSFWYHRYRRDFSSWFYVHGEFQIAKDIADLTGNEVNLRQRIIDCIQRSYPD